MYVLVDTNATAHVKRSEYVCKGLVPPSQGGFQGQNSTYQAQQPSVLNYRLNSPVLPTIKQKVYAEKEPQLLTRQEIHTGLVNWFS